MLSAWLAVYKRSLPSKMVGLFIALLVASLSCVALAMTKGQIAALRQETVDLFYHGYSNYMEFAFPEDEIRPVTCVPLTRDRSDPTNIGLNDVLGNYSLTLVDNLSTLAILASSSPTPGDENPALGDFQEGVRLLVENYGDGTEGPTGQGLRARGFDVDSKVQVFETVIRGVGGLLSAHLFAIGDLPIRGYNPPIRATEDTSGAYFDEIPWPNGFTYDGQLLRLAHDLATRLLPAFSSRTGLPYPRVNLRHGIPFYTNSLLYEKEPPDQCLASTPNSQERPEITETCTAGAGSLVLEFTVLSRLTGDGRFEELAKRAFWAVWRHRSKAGLVGAGILPETGEWTGPYSGIGASSDSFFEYALKSYILLSGLEAPDNDVVPFWKSQSDYVDDPNLRFEPLKPEENLPDAFLDTWQQAHSAIKRHLYTDHHHPHYVNAHIGTGAHIAFWIDSLSAFYPGLLTLGGELEEAIKTHLLYTALWTRYSALPERWSVRDGGVEGEEKHWPGRPEFIESNYHLYRATQDPWYLHVGEMVLRDVKRRCWTRCGLAGLEDVRTEEPQDRMQSFFLSETAKYLFLLFDPDHPLNSLDAPFVFSTEGHPLIIPRKPGRRVYYESPENDSSWQDLRSRTGFCPLPPKNVPFSFSATAARQDIFHAASLARLHLVPNINIINAPLLEAVEDRAVKDMYYRHSPTNYTFYPWTLPHSLIPSNGICSKISVKNTFDVHFPGRDGTVPNIFAAGGLIRIRDGVEIKAIEGLRIRLMQDNPRHFPSGHSAFPMDDYRISQIGNAPLGRDEKVFIQKRVIGDMFDPNFMLARDSVMVDLLVDLPREPLAESVQDSLTKLPDVTDDPEIILDAFKLMDSPPSAGISGLLPQGFQFDPADSTSDVKSRLNLLLQQLSSLLQDKTAVPNSSGKPAPPPSYHRVAAISATGVGAGPIPDVPDIIIPNEGGLIPGVLPWLKFYFAGEACNDRLPDSAATDYQVIILKRGGCSFSAKLANIPSFAPGNNKSLKLVIVVSYPEHEEPDLGRNPNNPYEDEDNSDSGDNPFPISELIRPLLDVIQHTPGGLARHHPIPMVMVGGGRRTYETFKRARGIGLKRRWHVQVQGVPVSNLVVLD